jgi:hypothetical protein
MSTIGYTILLAFGGTLAAALWTYVVGVAGAPGALLTAAAMRRSGATAIPTWGLLATVAGQLYASLAFTAFVIQMTSAVLADTHVFSNSVAWIVTFLVACAPASIALKDAARAEVKNVQHGATTLTAPLTAVGFFLFLLVPGTLEAGWSWVPRYAGGATRGEAPFPERYDSDRDSLSAAFRAFSSATELTQVPTGQSSLPSTPEHDAKVLRALEAGLSAGRSVGDDFLDWLHPHMREFFQGRYLAGQALYLEGLQQQNAQKQVRGIELIREWYTGFWETHSEAIASKAFYD